MSPIPAASPAVRTGFPRVSGDEPLGLMIEVDEMTFSPRERG